MQIDSNAIDRNLGAMLGDVVEMAVPPGDHLQETSPSE